MGEQSKADISARHAPSGGLTVKLRRAAALGKDFAVIGREAVGYRATRAPEILAKMIDARVRHRLGPFDFFFADLFNRPRATWRDYLREQPHTDRMLRVLHPASDEGITRDKVLATERALAGGLAVVPTLAVIGRAPSYPSAGLIPILNDARDIAQASLGWPDRTFVKPVSGSFGEGAIALTRQGQGWTDGTTSFDPAALAHRLLAERNPAGLLVQPRLANHRDMAAISSGQGLCATRIITALTVEGPEVVAVIHKILGQDAIADNFAGGMTGNLICSVDADSGRLGVAYGRSRGQRFLLTQFERCPTTGRPLSGFQLPEWPATRRLALNAATLFPELPLLGHDVVITDDGPLFLEANTHWRISLPQLAVGGLRPVLRRLIPRLAASEERRSAALSAIG